MRTKVNKEMKQGWRFAGDAARTTDEIASTRQGGFFVAVDSDLGVVVDKDCSIKGECQRKYVYFLALRH